MAEGNQGNEQSKFNQLLTKFLEEEHQVIDDTCLEKLLTHLSTEGSGQQLLQLVEARTFCPRCLTAFEKGVVSESVLSFALRLHGLVISTEAYFASAEVQEATKEITLAPRICMTTNASIQCAYVQMLAALLAHTTGVDWLAQSDLGMTIQTLYDKSNSIYVSRECQKFLSNFVVKLGAERHEIQNKILETSLQMIESGVSDNLNTALDLMTQIVEVCLKESNCLVPRELESRLSIACAKLFTCDTATLARAAKLRAVLCFAVAPDDVATLEESIVEIIKDLIDVKNVSVVQTLVLQCQSYWCVLKPRVPNLKEGHQLDHQLLYVQVAPVVQMDITNIKKECARYFLEKLCEHTRPSVQLQGCRLKKLVMSSSDPQLAACRSIHSLLQMKHFMSRENGIFVFRTLMCILVQLIDCDSEMITEAQSSGFMGTTLEAIIVLIDNFHFTWRESVETTCLATFMQELLCEPALSQRQTSQVLHVMRRAIENFMPPNLALLMNTLDNSPLQNLGPQLYRSAHNISWEVRDSALEVLTTIAQISDNKFPAFQAHLLEHKLCSLVVSMAVGDEESYVRVSALNCLSAMVVVPRYWDECLSKERLTEHMTSILCQESEGIVRREAAALVNAMLCCKRFNTEEQERMYMVMASTASADLHWEVKINALQFWKSNIEQEMCAQDMIDGKFPSVTFSTSEKKIVTLDTAAIHARLHAILAQLARTRCLAVLLTALHDPDLQVARKAAQILTSLQTLLRENGLSSDTTALGAGGDDIDAVRRNSNTDKDDADDAPLTSEQVIDGIVGQSDLALLASVCRAQLNLQDVPAPTPRGVALVQPGEFLQAITGVDLACIIASRESWIAHCSEHLDSLLTDMLEAREFEHKVNDMDCY